ncbi:SDR family oxidoreductase [Herbaspirillum sp. GCM10030257]|uniref:SDR family oxidoreductase n=1 Tax=Herbaspirillum sp. GCM10030257 TaxID=3273393 RepID=UPI003615101F
MELGLHGKTALVFGAAGGLGSAIARALALEGVNLVLADVNEASLSDKAAEFKAVGVAVMPLVWNLTDLGSIGDRFQLIEDRFGPVDILVNNTGGPPPTTAGGQPVERWHEYFQTMVLSVIAVTDRALPNMRARKWGRIITSTSSGVVAPIPNLGISNTLRMALVGWSKTLAREVGYDGVTANIVLPGRIATPRISFIDEQKAKREGRPVDEVVKESLESIPIGRYGRPEEYGAVVAFLSSIHAAYVTGSVIRVDGGLIPSI